MAEINDKYLSGAGLRTFFNYLNDTWWNNRKTNLQGTFLPLSGGIITGQLNTQDILPSATNLYNLGSLGTGNNDDKIWAGVYATNVVTENLTVTGSLTGTSDSAKKTDGSLSFGTYDENETNNSREIFNFDGSQNTFIRTDKGIGIITATDNTNTYLIGHTNSVSTTDDTTTPLEFGNQVYIPNLSFDDYGHITEKAWSIYTLPTLPMLEPGNNISITTDSTNNKITISTTFTADAEIPVDDIKSSFASIMGLDIS